MVLVIGSVMLPPRACAMTPFFFSFVFEFERIFTSDEINLRLR